MARPRTSELTSTHSRILRAVACYVEKRGHASIVELVAELGLAGDTSLTPTLKIMERNGFIKIHGGGERGRRRTITLTERSKVILGWGGLRVLGCIPAGPLAEVIEQSQTIIASCELLPHKPGDFLLIVQGDSMIGDGILPGDKVLLRPNVEVQNREIVAVHIGDEYLATLKHIYFGSGKGKVTLKASNTAYKEIIVSAKDVRIAGVFRGLVRTS